MDRAPSLEAAARARYERVQAVMTRQGVGALLLATPHLAAFASGARRVQVAGSGGALPWVVIAAGAPAATIFTTDPDGAPPWMPAAHVAPLCWDRERQLGRIAELVGTTSGAVACDVWSPGLSALAGKRALVDAASLLAGAVAPKTDAEVALIVNALAAARRGLVAATGALRAGETVAAIMARFHGTMSVSGAGFPLSAGLVWRVGEHWTRLGAGAVVEARDVVAVEMGLWTGGHAGLAGTTVVADGRVLTAARRAWAASLCAV